MNILGSLIYECTRERKREIEKNQRSISSIVRNFHISHFAHPLEVDGLGLMPLHERMIEERFQVGSIGRILLETLLDKVNKVSAEAGLGQRGRRLVHNVLEQLEDGHRSTLVFLHAGRVAVRIRGEQLLDLAVAGHRNRIAAYGHLHQREAQAPDVRLHRVSVALQALRLQIIQIKMKQMKIQTFSLLPCCLVEFHSQQNFFRQSSR